jgi:hypothetical protein
MEFSEDPAVSPFQSLILNGPLERDGDVDTVGRGRLKDGLS